MGVTNSEIPVILIMATRASAVHVMELIPDFGPLQAINKWILAKRFCQRVEG